MDVNKILNPPMNSPPNIGQPRNLGPETGGNVSSMVGNPNAMLGPRLGSVRMAQPVAPDNQQAFRQQQNYQGPPRFVQNGSQFRPQTLQRDNNGQPRQGDPYQNQVSADQQRSSMDPPQNQQLYSGTQPRYAGPVFQTRPPMPGQPPMAGQPTMPGQLPMAGQPTMPGQPPMAGQLTMPGQPPMAGQPTMPGQPQLQGQPQIPRQPPVVSQPSLSRQSSISSIDPSRFPFSPNQNSSNQPNVQGISEGKLNGTATKNNSEEKQFKNLPQNLIRKSSNLNLKGPEMTAPTDSDSKSESSDEKNLTEKEKEVSEQEPPKLAEKSGLRKGKENKAPPKGLIEDENIPSGAVHKNIKFFEERDTAKIPLIPAPVIPQKLEKTKSSSSSSDMKKTKNQRSESGVDETPMIHPNLRSIFEVPSKVAKLSLLKFGKTDKFKRGKNLNDKKKFVRWNNCYTPPSQPNRNFSKNLRKNLTRKSKAPSFSPEEELLAFFHNSKKARIKRDESSSDQRGLTKNLEGKKSTPNGDIPSPKKTPSKLPGPKTKNSSLSSPTKTPLKSPATQGAKSLPKTPESPLPPEPLIKKVPMNKIQVGAAPSPNLKAARSKVGSLMNTTHKPGGGNIKIENHKIDFSKTQSRIEAKNDQYVRSGGDKKIPQVKLQWEAKSKVGSLENATYKPGGGERKIESIKLDFREKAKPKVGSKDNVKHVPGGGAVKIESQKLEFKAQSKVGSLDNVKHKPGGGDVKIFDDKTYLKQISSNASEGRVSGTQSFGDLSVVREVEGRSAPGTPGHKIVKIKKTTTIRSAGATPQLKNITEVTVASQNPKASAEKTSSKQEIKLTLTKSSPLADFSPGPGTVEIIRTPAKDFAPVLKPSLSRTEANNSDDIYGKSFTKFINSTSDKSKNLENSDARNERKNLDIFKQTSESSDLLDGKLDSGDPSVKFLRDEMAAHEKIEKIWLEKNNLEANGDRGKQLKSDQEISYSTAADRGGNAAPPPYHPQTSYSKTEKLIEPTMSNKNFPINLSPSSNMFVKNSGQYRIGLQSSPYAPSQQSVMQNANQQMSQEKYQPMRSSLPTE